MGINCNLQYENITVQIRPEDRAVLVLAAAETGMAEIPEVVTNFPFLVIPAVPAIPAIPLEQFITELIEVAAARYRHDHSKCHCQGPEPCFVPDEPEEEDL